MAATATPAQAAERYRPCDDLWLATAYFNSTHSRNRHANYRAFAERLRLSNLNLVTVECAFGDDPFELPPENTVQVRSHDVLWQKERLLNLAFQHVPPRIRKVAWLDCDVLFTNPDWAVETSRLLDTLPVVQPFEQIIRLEPGQVTVTPKNKPGQGFGAVITRDPSLLRHGSDRHGHTGFGWAYRRDILDKHGLYDGGIIGDGDHMMAHAVLGDFSSPCLLNTFSAWPAPPPGPQCQPSRLRRLLRRLPRTVKKMLRRPPPVVARLNPAHFEHFKHWGEGFYADIRGRIGYTPGSVLHLWHGSRANRRFSERRRPLVENRYSPLEDIRLNASGCWEWNSDKPALHAAVEEYFHLRREDDNESTA